MRTAALVLGLIAGIFGMIGSGCSACSGIAGGTLEVGTGGDTDTAGEMGATGAGIGLALLLASIIGIVGASLSPRQPKIGGAFQLTVSLGGFVAIMLMGGTGGDGGAFSGGVGLLTWALPGFLFFLGGIFGLVARTPRKEIT